MHSLLLMLLVSAAQDEVESFTGLGRYQIETTELQVVGEGPTRVSVESQSASPRAGAFPLCFTIDNSKGPKQTLTLSYRGNSTDNPALISRSVELEAGERRRVTLPVPAMLNSGLVEVDGAGAKGGIGVYFNVLGSSQHAVLALGTGVELQELAGPVLDSTDNQSIADTRVMLVRPSDAPSEAMAYSGYELIIVTSGASLESLSASQRSALEAHVLSGGSLVIGALRNSTLLPLATDFSPGEHAYELGTIRVVEGPFTKMALTWAVQLINPRAPRYPRANQEVWQLLPQATPPLLRFLLIIIAFSIVIGPGSVWLARRRGQMVLLFSIPIVATTTCALIIVSSLLGEGFSIHTAVYSYTWLDTPRNRALTLGLGAYYANLSNSSTRLSTSTTVVMPWSDDSERLTASYDWGEGIGLGGDFMPSRRYREWGVVAIEPTRAHLSVKRVQGNYVAFNALGVPVRELRVRLDNTDYAAKDLADGAQATLTPNPAVLPQLMLPKPRPATRAKLANLFDDGHVYEGDDPEALWRFNAQLVNHFAKPLERNEFIAVVDGQGFYPTGGVSCELFAGNHLVRGALSP